MYLLRVAETASLPNLVRQRPLAPGRSKNARMASNPHSMGISMPWFDAAPFKLPVQASSDLNNSTGVARASLPARTLHKSQGTRMRSLSSTYRWLSAGHRCGHRRAVARCNNTRPSIEFYPTKRGADEEPQRLEEPERQGAEASTAEVKQEVQAEDPEPSRLPAEEAATAGGAAAARARAKEDAKGALLAVIANTDRGSRTTASERASIEEAQVHLETFGAADLDYQQLNGLWRLVYTTALDLIPVLKAGYLTDAVLPLPPLKLGSIYQRFSGQEEGSVTNIICFGVPFVLQEDNGIVFTVGAKYQSLGRQTLSLVFEDAGVDSIRISDSTEALLAPAILPRTSLQHMLLLAIKEFKLRVPLAAPSRLATSVSRGAGAYQMTFLDDDVLIGRALSSGGTFIFVRDESDEF